MIGYAPRPVLIVVGYVGLLLSYINAKQFAHLPQTHFYCFTNSPIRTPYPYQAILTVCDEIWRGECRNSSSSSASGSAGSDVAGGSDEGMEKFQKIIAYN